MRVLVAGFGNVLLGDDGFGVRLLERLEKRLELAGPGSGREVTLLEAGIGGVSFVQESMAGYDAVILLDAIERADEGDRTGEIRVLELEVADPSKLDARRARDYLADVHYAEPGRALALAKGIGTLPERCYLVGCVVDGCELGEELGAPVAAALAEAEERVLELLGRLATAPA